MHNDYSPRVKHKGDRPPTTRLEWVGLVVLVAMPVGFILAVVTGHVVLALVVLTPIGAYAQWSIWVENSRLLRRAAALGPAH